MINIYYTRFTEQLPIARWQSYLNTLPAPLQQKVCRYRRWQDQHSSLFSRLLLRHALCQAGYPSDCLSQLQYGKYHRPYIDQVVDFNISHSGEYIVCAITHQGKVGIDVEKIKTIDLSNFENYMTPQQWSDIMNSPNSLNRFFDYWTIKEGVMKADGRGMSLPLLNIHTQGYRATVDKTIWYFTKISLDPNYACHVVTSWENPTIHLIPIHFNNELKF